MKEYIIIINVNFIIIKFFLFCFFVLINYKYINKNRLLIKNRLTKKNNNFTVCICTLGKNENKYIKEFIEYYKKYDIDKIFLYDNNDNDGEIFEEVINEYIIKGFVELIDWRGKKRKQIEILNHCYQNNYKKFDWLIFYDIDEYINLKNFSNIKNFLNQEKFTSCQIIYLNWVIHLDNNLINFENKSLHERFPVLERNSRNKNKTFYIPVKSILKGHIPNILIDDNHILNKSLKACNGFGFPPKIKSYFMEADFTNYYIDHYYFKSLEEFIEKLNRGSAKTNDDLRIKLYKIKRYIKMNKIDSFKLKYIEKKTKINISKYINQFKRLSYYLI